MTQTPPSGQGAPSRSEFGSVTAPARPSDSSRPEWGATQTTASQAANGAPAQAPVADTRATTVVPPYAPAQAPAQGAPGTAGRAPLVTGSKAPGAPATAPPPPGAPAAPTSRPARGIRNRGPRRARLQLRHINPWTVLKFSCVLSIALFFVWLIVVGILFGVLDAAGVVQTLNDAYIKINPDATAPIRAGIVFGGAAIIGAVNIVLFIALSTIGAVVYNLCADLVGGIEITLSER